MVRTTRRGAGGVSHGGAPAIGGHSQEIRVSRSALWRDANAGGWCADVAGVENGRLRRVPPLRDQSKQKGTVGGGDSRKVVIIKGVKVPSFSQRFTSVHSNRFRIAI